MNKTLTNYFNCRLLLVILLVGLMGIGRTQNLVPNPSFENHTISCHGMHPGGDGATDWYSPLINGYYTYTYNNSCSDSICCGVPINFYGHNFQYAHTGNAYVAGYFMDKDNNQFDIRNYFQTKLLTHLSSGKCYYIEFYINLDDFYVIATNNIGLLIGDTGILSYGSKYAAANPQIQQFGNPVITDTMNWIKVAGIYIAHGGEQYITIGNFKDDAHTDTLMMHYFGGYAAGYLIDDVSVIPLDSMQLKADAGRDTTIIKGDSVWIGSRLCGLTNVVWYDAANNIIDTGAPGLWVKPTSNTFYVIEQNVCGQYSRDTVNITVAALPVIIENYKLIIDNGIQNTVENVWTTSTEINVSHFNVQRSEDGLLFNTVGKVNAKGAGSYTFNDLLTTPDSRLTKYYRLEIVDKNGSKTYSEIRSVLLTTHDSRFTITPNPANDKVTIAAMNLKDINILDNAGRVVVSKEGIVTNAITIDISTLAKGVYFVKATDKSGRLSVGKMVVLK